MVDLAELAMKQLYGESLKENAPARIAVGMAALPLGARVEITCTTVLLKLSLNPQRPLKGAGPRWL